VKKYSLSTDLLKVGAFFMRIKGKSTNERVSRMYTDKTDILHYKPTGRKPNINELIKETKTEELLKDIENSTVSNEEKTFLKKAAMRHLAFNYKKIAEYYANSEKDMQDLMEKSALVIIDYNNAIQNGFVRLSKRIKEMCKQNA